MKANQFATDIRPWLTKVGKKLLREGFFYSSGDNDSHYFNHCDGRTVAHNLRTGKVKTVVGSRICRIRRKS